MRNPMHAMVMRAPRQPLVEEELTVPEPGRGEILLRVLACGVCRTDLHIADGELDRPKRALVLGHETVGRVEAAGAGVERFAPGDRVGVPWLGHTCGVCPYCRGGRENLCAAARFTGYDIDGGYAQYAVADERFCFALPPSFSDAEAAPLLCAGLIGHRALQATGDAQRVGIYGFGAAAHIVTQVARHEGRRVFAFTRAGDEAAQHFALELGAEWAGSSDGESPCELDAAILFAPVGALVPVALRAVARGGAVVCAGIHMSDIPSFPYSLLWGERSVRSIANLTRRDGEEFFETMRRAPVRVEVVPFALRDANQALAALKNGQLRGAAVLIPPD